MIKGHEVDHCFRCGGSFLEKGNETKILGESSSSNYWRGTEISENKGVQNILCPKDSESLITYSVGFDGSNVEVDLCSKCEGLWLDPKEGKKLLNIVLHAGQDKAATFNEKPGFKSYLFQAFSGMPVEAWNPVHHRPVLTLLLLAALVFIFVLQLSIPGITEAFILYPQQFLSGESLWTLITAGFLHSSLAHLLGNLYFLYIFGDNVEDHLGKTRFCLVYVGAIVVSSLSFVIVRYEGDTGVVGASGAIAALMGAYMVVFPKIKLYFTVLFFPVRLGVTWYLSFWLLFNIVMMLWGQSGVAWSAHIGGFVFGLGAGYFFRFRSIQEHINS
jgi:membrane associated rhomboid family serine protease/Zn-finger nucleic acid-binding protein